MSDMGALTIKFEPGIQATDTSLTSLKDNSLISIKLIPSEDSIGWLDESYFDFDWKVTHLDKNELRIQVEFVNPLKISNFQEFDLLLVMFHETSLDLIPKQPEIFDSITNGYTIYFDVPP